MFIFQVLKATDRDLEGEGKVMAYLRNIIILLEIFKAPK